MKTVFIVLSVVVLQLISFKAFSIETIFIRIIEIRKPCLGVKPSIKIILANGSIETIELEKTEMFMTESVLIKIKETVDRFINLGYHISSSTSTFTGNPQECLYLTDYYLIKE